MDLELTTRRGTIHHRTSVDSIAPTLIQVPALSGRGTSRRALPRRRRRLRREVRVAASALLFALPMAGLLLMLGAGHPESEARAAVEEAPSISISVEPIALPHGGATLRLDETSPTVLIDEIVPEGAVSGAEEAAHAGG